MFSFKKEDFRTFNDTHPEIELKFIESETELLSQLADIEYLDTWQFKYAWYERAPNLKRIFTPAAGREYIDAHPRVPIHFGTFHGEMMAETALGLVMQSSLRLAEYRAQQANRVWHRLPLRLMKNQTVMILGYGSIGRTCGKLLQSNGMQVIGVKRQTIESDDNGIKLIATNELEQWLPNMDHVISFLPDDHSTKHFVGSALLSCCKTSAYFYNFGRGATVDESALIAALQNGEITGAALDVTEIEPLPEKSALWGNPKVTLLPHASAYYEEYRNAHVTDVTDLISSLNK